MWIELNGVLSFTVKICDARSGVTALNEQWIKEPIGILKTVLRIVANGGFGIVQMECLRLHKWNACVCTNYCDYDKHMLFQ